MGEGVKGISTLLHKLELIFKANLEKVVVVKLTEVGLRVASVFQVHNRHDHVVLKGEFDLRPDDLNHV